MKNGSWFLLAASLVTLVIGHMFIVASIGKDVGTAGAGIAVFAGIYGIRAYYR
ncbi:MAG: hypothetical protein V3V40_05980 [Nitrosomonadaceae bacterium]